MSPNPDALRISRRYSYGYHDVRVAINLLVNKCDWEREKAVEFVEDLAKDHVDLADAVDQVVEQKFGVWRGVRHG